MKRLIVFLFLIPFGLFAQEEGAASPIKIGLTITPSLNNLLIQRTDESNTLRFGFGGNFIAQKALSDHWTLETGLGFKTNSFQHYRGRLTFPSDINPQDGIVSYSQLMSTGRTNEFFIPLKAHYLLGQRKISLTAGFGVHYLWSNAVNRSITYGNGDIETLNSTEIDPVLNFSFMFGLRFTQPISNKIGLIIEPTYTLHAKDYLIPLTNAQSFGLTIGVVLE